MDQYLLIYYCIIKRHSVFLNNIKKKLKSKLIWLNWYILSYLCFNCRILYPSLILNLPDYGEGKKWSVIILKVNVKYVEIEV